MFSFSMHEDSKWFSEVMLWFSSFNSLHLMKINPQATASRSSPVPLDVRRVPVLQEQIFHVPRALVYIIAFLLKDPKMCCESSSKAFVHGDTATSGDGRKAQENLGCGCMQCMHECNCSNWNSSQNTVVGH